MQNHGLKYQFWKNVTSEKWNSGGLNTFTTYLSSLLGVIAEYNSKKGEIKFYAVDRSDHAQKFFSDKVLPKLFLGEVFTKLFSFRKIWAPSGIISVR